MGLRIPIKICKEDKHLNVIALLNTGFETEEPIISIPPSIAEQLGLSINEALEFEGPAYLRGLTYISDRVRVIVEKENNISSIDARAVITPGEEEVVLSDKCIEGLGIIIDLKRKKWWIT